MRIAIITGASSGVGKAFVYLIAKSDYFFNNQKLDQLWIVSRNIEKLENIKNELSSEIIHPLALDLADKSDVQQLEFELQKNNPDVFLLINSAGIGLSKSFVESDTEILSNTIDLNCHALTYITKICLPYMIKTGKDYKYKDGPRIIQMGSSSGFLPQPGFSVYAATKAYVISFSRAIHEEIKKYNIGCMVACPGPLDTDFFSAIDKSGTKPIKGIKSLFIENPESFAKKAIELSEKGRSIFSYKFSQKFLHLIANIIPCKILITLSNKFS